MKRALFGRRGAGKVLVVGRGCGLIWVEHRAWDEDDRKT